MFPVCQVLYFSCFSLSHPQQPFEEGAIFSCFLKMIKLTELCFFFFFDRGWVYQVLELALLAVTGYWERVINANDDNACNEHDHMW